MVRVSAFPTVEWLNKSVIQRNEFHERRTQRSLNRPRDIWKADILTALKMGRTANTRFSEGCWIRTPDGERYVDCILQNRRRRIGIRISGKLEIGVQEEDALVLVYGGFDMIYRVRQVPPTGSLCNQDGCLSMTGEENSHAVVDLLVAMHPRWFRTDFRVNAGREMASHTAADELKRHGSTTSSGYAVTRIRLTRSTDWVNNFESALGVPRLNSFIPSFRRTVTAAPSRPHSQRRD